MSVLDPRSQRALIRAYVIDNMRGAKEEIDDYTPLFDAGLMDWCGALRFVGFVEASFAIDVADDEITTANFGSIDRICAFVARKLGLTSSAASVEILRASSFRRAFASP